MPTFYDRFVECVEHWPGNIALEIQHRERVESCTYAELRHMAESIGSWLTGNGFPSGARVVILADNHPRWVAVFLGVVASGCTAVPLDTALHADQITTLLKDSGSSLLFCDVKHLATAREAIGALPIKTALINPANAAIAETTLRELESAARAMGLQIQIFRASTSREIDAAFATFVRERTDALFVATEAFLNSRRVQFATLTARYAIPATFSNRDFAEVGGLMSYGADIGNAFRQAGVYTGRILKGAKPADLPVVQSSKLELVINAQTARMLGLAVPDKLLATADEVIE
jgi:acyl-CoA synthetase (AMP-forming)/AMP-acid ligase II